MQRIKKIFILSFCIFIFLFLILITCSEPIEHSTTTTTSGSSTTSSSTPTTTPTTVSGQVASPVISISDDMRASISVAKIVSINCSTSGATIRYTTDGSTPTQTNGTIYTSPFTLYYTTTIKAIAYKSGMSDSNITTENVTYNLALSNHVTDWRNEIIYFMLTDRFGDGDSTNNSQMPDSGDYEPGDGKKYQGGDFRGIINKINYLKNLGITTIWISSPVKQAWENSQYASYHGYWAQNFKEVDPHLGTMADFREMVKVCHDNGIKVIMDIVINHTASLFFYDLNGNGTPDSNEWEPAYNAGGYTNAKWLEDLNEDWVRNSNRVKPMPVELQDWNFFSRRGGNATTGSGDEVLYGDFAGLRDINTLNSTVRTTMKDIFKWWIKNTNIDGFRIDTVKHIEIDFWSDFCNEIRTWAKSSEGGNKNFYMVAEVYDEDVSDLGLYTNSNRLDSVLGFNMARSVFDWNDGDDITIFKDKGTWSSRPKTKTVEDILTATKNEANLNANSLHTNGDGLIARQKIGYFIDNHDLNRFLNSTNNISNESATSGELINLRVALGWLLTWEGIPVIYYGTEQNYKQSMALSSGGEHGAGAGNCEKGNRPRLWEVKNSNNNNTAYDESNNTFALIKGLTTLRKTYPSLSKGDVSIKWVDDGVGSTNDDGILAFIRKGATVDEDILVVINTHYEDKAPSAGSGNDLGTDWPVGTTLEVVDIPDYDDDSYGTLVTNDDRYVDSDGGTGRTLVTTVTTFAQSGKTSAVYFQLPPNSIRILKKQGYNP